MKVSSFTHAAPNKPENEDRLKHISLGMVGELFAIADGMGGHLGGAIAAQIAIDIIEKKSPTSHGDLQAVFPNIVDSIIEHSSGTPTLSSMGTTLSMCLVHNNKGYVAHVGDTRIYHLRSNGILRRTVDQTELQELLDQGVLSREGARNYPRKNVLLSALTSRGDYQVYETVFDVQPGDRLILMTDGAYQKITLHALRDLSVENENLENYSRSVLAAIEQHVPTDDYSALFVEF